MHCVPQNTHHCNDLAACNVLAVFTSYLFVTDAK